ncbi:uncharacterized protein LOC110816083 isoform X2 [Carica papaya]|uniref:uncharacterized protein LOC110816083 isoform X2 n=1 Tax=Carica papaya TaxID=3649 RepID=UPI000B8CBBA9|nr:uncharacterized protein LOC110816083 isoform X2 [Carica papaya]
MATLSAKPEPSPVSVTLTLDSLPSIDMATFTQSELRALSLCSPSAIDVCRTDDLVIPSIDPSTFNESAGSRRQIFTRSRPSSPSHHHHHHHRHRVAGLFPSSKPSSVPDDPEFHENRSIIASLKHSLRSLPEFYDLDIDYTPPVPFSALAPDDSFNFRDAEVGVGSGGERKKKKGRKPKPKVILDEREKSLDIVNKNGVAVDLVALADLEDPYGEELRKRTEGMVSEEQLLGFLRDLGGQWCSRRRKRKIVDASIFKDVLPVGWRLLLGLKRKEGRAWIYCRRYISPGGHHFLSCQEVSAYLQSYFGRHGLQKMVICDGNNVQEQEHTIVSQKHADAILEENAQRQADEHAKEITLLGFDNLAEVQIHDLFECRKCNLKFDDKDTYLQHLLSFHQRTTRRYRLGSSVGDGVIVKDGKFECQFCHKTFHERRRYNGHVGIHVRNYVRGIEEPANRQALQKRIESPCNDELPTRISKMDALIEIAQNSILQTSTMPDIELAGGLTPGKLITVPNQDLPASNSEDELNSNVPFSEPETESDMSDRTLDQDLVPRNSKHMIIDEEIMMDYDSHVVDVKVDSLLDTSIVISADKINCNSQMISGKDVMMLTSAEIGKFGTELKTDVEMVGGKDVVTLTSGEIGKSNAELKTDVESHLRVALENQNVCDIDNNVNSVTARMVEHLKPSEEGNSENFGSGSQNSEPAKIMVRQSEQGNSEGNILHENLGSMPVLQPKNCFQTHNELKHESEDGKPENVSGYGELRLDEIEQLKFNFGTGQESLALPEVAIDLAGNEGMEGAYDCAVQFESEEVMLNMRGRSQLTTVCVWCGMEFSHEDVDPETQSDSVGYMCPTCKAKISGQLNAV